MLPTRPQMRMIECEICHEEYQESDSELHRETCVVRLLFRCSICDEDYVSMEGLWNHLDQHHGIEDEKKESRCQQLEAKHKLLQCDLCNDQRGYSEVCYWLHMNKLHCNTELRDQTIANYMSIMPKKSKPKNADSVTIEAKRLKRSLEEQINEKTCLNALQKIDCSICGQSFDSRNEYKEHFEMCKLKLWICNLCGSTFKRFRCVAQHNEENHPENGNSETMQLVQVQHNDPKTKNVAEKTPNDTDLAIVEAIESRLNASDNDLKVKQVKADNLNAGFMKQNGSKQIKNSKKTRHSKLGRGVKGKVQCEHCLRKFYRLASHLPLCRGSAKYACEFCGRKFTVMSRLESHRKNIHQVESSSQNANLGDADHAVALQQPIDKIDTTQEISICTVCGFSFDSADSLIAHEVNCLKQAEEPAECKFAEIKVEETTLQNPDYQSPAGSLNTTLHPHGSRSNNETEATLDSENVIKVEAEHLENEEQNDAEHQETTESTERRLECPICGDSFGSTTRGGYASAYYALRYHKRVSHTEPQFKCHLCQRKYFFVHYLNYHMKGCSALRCHECHIKFPYRALLEKHNIEKHPKNGKPEDEEDLPEDQAEDEEDLPEDGVQAEIIATARRPPVRNETGDLVWPCKICKLTFGSKTNRQYHMVVCHTMPKHKCSFCKRPFHFNTALRRHVKGCFKKRSRKIMS